MNDLRVDIQAILIKKCDTLKNMNAGTIDWATLDMEINDAQHILIQIDSKSPHSHKLSAIQAIQKQTTSGSIYETVQVYLEKEKEVEDKKFYFMTFFQNNSLVNASTDEHPMDWQIRMNKIYPRTYVLTGWREISEVEHDKYGGVK